MISKLKAKLISGDHRSSKAKQNIISTFAIKGGSVLINFVLVPTYIAFLDVANYGIWITLSTIIAWFSFFDIGFGHGLRNKFAEAVANNQIELAKRYVSTTYAVLVLITAPLWLLFFVANSYIDWASVLNVDQSQRDELSRVALLVFTFFCLLFVLKLISSILSGYQQPAKASLFDFLANAISLAAILLCKYLSVTSSLTSLAVITGGASTGVLLFSSIWFFRNDLKLYAPSIAYVDFSHIKSLMGLGIKFFFIQIGAILVFESTNIVTTQILGPASVTIYNTTYKYFAMATMVTGIVAAPFWSAFTDAYVKGDYGWMKKIVRKLDYFFLGMLGLLIIMLAISKLFFQLWVGNNLLIPWTTATLMAVNIALAIRWNLMISVINGTGKLKLQLITNLVLSLLFIPLAIFLGKKYLLNGIVLANLIINLLYAIIVPIQGNKIVHQKATGIWNK